MHLDDAFRNSSSEHKGRKIMQLLLLLLFYSHIITIIMPYVCILLGIMAMEGGKIIGNVEYNLYLYIYR